MLVETRKDFERTRATYQRAARNPIYRVCFVLSQSQPVQWVFSVLIAVNVALSTLDHHGMDNDMEATLEKLHLAFTILFCTELSCKLVG